MQLEGEAAAEEVSILREELRAEKVKGHDNWEMHCRQLIRWDAEGAERDAEIAELKTRLAMLEAAGRVLTPVTVVGVVPHAVVTSTHVTPPTTSVRRFVPPSHVHWSTVTTSMGTGVVSSTHTSVVAGTGTPRGGSSHLPVTTSTTIPTASSAVLEAPHSSAFGPPVVSRRGR